MRHMSIACTAPATNQVLTYRLQAAPIICAASVIIKLVALITMVNVAAAALSNFRNSSRLHS